MADGDPASDMLLAESVFYPYSPAVSPALQRALGAEVAAASRAGFRVKIALIGSRLDLGAVPELLGQPQRYAEFLEREINFHGEQPLLVVMADGYGVQGMPPASMRAARALPKPTGASSNDLARAAIATVPALAAADHHSVKRPRVPAVTGSSAGLGVPLVALLALVCVAAAALILLTRRRRLTRR